MQDQSIHVVVVDTAGRLAIVEELMEELSILMTILNPRTALGGYMSGQDIVNVANGFKNLTKWINGD